jgi:hypothetical protein
MIVALLAPLLVLNVDGAQIDDTSEFHNSSNGYFIANHGQINNSDIGFYARVLNGYITLGTNCISFWNDASQKSDLFVFETSVGQVIVGLSELEYRCNYFLGSRGTYTDVACYQSIEYVDIAEGANLLVRYVDNGVDFTLELKGDLTTEEIDAFWNAIRRDSSNLVPDSSGIRLRFGMPTDYSSKFTPSQVDDNSLLSMCLGGSESDEAKCMARDQQGNIYVAGSTYSPEFPLLNAFQSYQGSKDAFVTTNFTVD